MRPICHPRFLHMSSSKNAVQNVLRWIAVIPGAVVASFLVIFPTSTPTATPTATAPGSFAAVILATKPANLKGYWKCDETSGTTLADSSGNSKNLTISGAIGTNYFLGEAGEQGTCFRTDGISGYASRTDSVIPSMNGQDFTLFALFKGGTDFNAGGALSIHNSANELSRAQMGNDKGGVPSRAFGNSRGNGLTPNVQVAGGTAFDGTWHSIAFRRTRDAFQVFVDGVSVASGTGTFAAGGPLNRTTLMHPLNPGTPHATYAKGSVQHAAIWDVALSDAEIASIQTARNPSATPTATPTPTPTPSPTRASLLDNISTRAFVQTGDDMMIGGFIVQGTEPKSVIIRAIGPELAQYGVPDVLADPTLELHDGTGALIASNDSWLHTMLGGIITSDQVSDIRNSGRAPTDARESAIIAELPAGNYTAIVRGVNNTIGIALAEVYDLGPEGNSILANVSTRALVQIGDNVMIGGFIIRGTQPKRVILRALGPELDGYGVPNVLPDPTLELHDGSGALIASNDDWQHTIIGGIITADQVRDIRSSGHAPMDPRESAIIADLPPSNYTGIVRDKNIIIGVALVEVYDLD